MSISEIASEVTDTYEFADMLGRYWEEESEPPRSREYTFPCDQCPNGEATITMLGSASVAEHAVLQEEHYDIHAPLDLVRIQRVQMGLPPVSAQTVRGADAIIAFTSKP